VKNASEYALTHEGKFKDNTQVKTLFSYRTSRISGLWGEASPAADDPNYSYISLSDWDTQNSAILFKQDYSYRLNSNWQLNGGIKFERKTLTKAFDVCGYWLGSICSASADEPGPLGFGAGVFDSRADTFIVQPGVSGTIPGFNINKTKDSGLFIQGIYDQEAWRFSGGLRYDYHSDYGSTTNPRVSAVYRLNDLNSLKLLYGEAFQEPPNILLFGGWSGRRANPDLKPETVKNYEFIYLRQQESWLHEISLYLSKFENVVKEEALNAGSREVRGFEYRGSFEMDNFITDSQPINGYVYYTYTDNTSSIHYEYGHVDDETGTTSNGWFDGETDIGDISPHKVNIGVNVPVLEQWNINLRAQYHGETELYSRNRLRSQGENLDAYFLVNLTFGYLVGDMSVLLKVDNLFNERYFLPGERAANAGNDFDAPRSSGFKSSFIPTPLRSYMLMVSYKF
jgi:iron complex outermembrane receptor protein